MKLSRVFAYGALGIITGLLLENKMLDVRRKSAAKKLANKKHDEAERRKSTLQHA